MNRWLTEGVFDALDHEYLRSMVLGVCDAVDTNVLVEAYECALPSPPTSHRSNVDKASQLITVTRLTQVRVRVQRRGRPTGCRGRDPLFRRGGR